MTDETRTSSFTAGQTVWHRLTADKGIVLRTEGNRSAVLWTTGESTVSNFGLTATRPVAVSKRKNDSFPEPWVLAAFVFVFALGYLFGSMVMRMQMLEKQSIQRYHGK